MTSSSGVTQKKKKKNLMYNKIQSIQNIALHTLNGPPYVSPSNHTIHSDLEIPFVYEGAKLFYNRYHLHFLSSYPNGSC